MKTNYAGIDYGQGKTNISKDGIRFGVIQQNAVGQAWYDSSEADYGEAHCPKCGNETADGSIKEVDTDTDYYCSNCKYGFNSDEAFSDEALGFTLNDGEYIATSDDSGDIFITQSPYYTYAQLCSPCAPGACYLPNEIEPNPRNKCFCFGHDWFENGKAPYTVYNIKTNKIVEAK